jgi:hypothetical protein
MFQVVFELPQVSATWPPFTTERVWAKTTATPDHLEVQNIPFFVLGVSLGDVIRTKPDQQNRQLVFDGLVRHCGHSTIRILLRDKSPENRHSVLEMLRAAGCTWEFTNIDFHFAADVPEDVDYRSLRQTLIDLISAGSIEVEEAFVAAGHQAQLEV